MKLSALPLLSLSQLLPAVSALWPKDGFYIPDSAAGEIVYVRTSPDAWSMSLFQAARIDKIISSASTDGMWLVASGWYEYNQTSGSTTLTVAHGFSGTADVASDELLLWSNGDKWTYFGPHYFPVPQQPCGYDDEWRPGVYQDDYAAWDYSYNANEYSYYERIVDYRQNRQDALWALELEALQDAQREREAKLAHGYGQLAFGSTWSEYILSQFSFSELSPFIRW